MAYFSVTVNIFVKFKFEVMQMLLWPIKLDENEVLTKIFTQRYTKTCSKGFYYLIQLGLHFYSTPTF